MSFAEIFFGFLIALAAGALIGIEREQSMAVDRKTSLGGIRTFPLIALAGALSALLSHTLGFWPVLGSLLVMGAFLTVSYYQEWEKERTRGVTTEVAALITFLLGALALMPNLPLETKSRYLLIVASAGVVMALLSFKQPLHQAVARVSDDDIYATAKFVIITLVILPLLPDRPLGPLQVLNPFEVWLMVVLIAGVSFVGYIAARLIGERQGIAVTGLLGGLVSSTAVTVSLATQVRRAPAASGPAAVAILVASGTMFVRILVIVGIVDPSLAAALFIPLGTMTAAGYAYALVFYRMAGASRGEAAPIAHRNPFELRAALQFGLLYAAVILAAKAAATYFGDRGLYLSSLLAGTTDVDAITLSVAAFHRDGLSASTAAIAITLAAFTNTIVKAGVAAWLGGWGLTRRVGGGFFAVLGAGALALLLLRGMATP
jgi:uncharacterized membrane protein (DUF4010 family)